MGEIFDLARLNNTDRVTFDTIAIGRFPRIAGWAVTHSGEDVYENRDLDVALEIDILIDDQMAVAL